MAKIRELSKQTIDALRRTIDFYYWRGIPIARKWPKGPKTSPSPIQKASQAAFKSTRTRLKEHFWYKDDLSRELYKGISQQWIDHYTGSALQYFQNWKTNPPVITSIKVIRNVDPVRLELEGTNLENLWLKFYQGKPQNRISWKYRSGVHDYCMIEGGSSQYSAYPVKQQYDEITSEYTTATNRRVIKGQRYEDYSTCPVRPAAWANMLGLPFTQSLRDYNSQNIIGLNAVIVYQSATSCYCYLHRYGYFRGNSGLIINPDWLLDPSIEMACIWNCKYRSEKPDLFVASVEGTPCEFNGKTYTAYFPLEKYISQENSFFTEIAPFSPSYSQIQEVSGDPNFTQYEEHWAKQPADTINLQVRRRLSTYYCDIPRAWLTGQGSFISYDPFSGIMLGPWVSTARFWDKMFP